jgi:sulfate adenylyltransferase subunit 2
MNHLDAIENESVYILREAFNLIERLGMLWSFGKDSNVLVWLTKRAFFGHVPFPVATIDTEKKMQEMCAFRDRYRVEWNLDLVVGTCPPIEPIDPTLPPAARSARKTAALKDLINAHGYNGLIAAIRRDEEGTRAKERVFSPRGEGSKWNFATSRRNSGTSTTMISRPAPVSTCIRSCIGPSSTSGATSAARTSPIVPLYFARNGRRYRPLGDKDITFPVASTADTRDKIIAEIESIRSPSGRDGRWIMRPRTASSGCARTAMSE